jgi:hypothetical protein
MDASHGDLTQVPLAYPLSPVDGPRLLLAGCEHLVRPRARRPLGASRTPHGPDCTGEHAHLANRPLGAALEELGEAPLAERTPVLAVGSNASPAVLAHKLGRHGVSTVVPVVTGVVRTLDVTHSAHVSRGGYVPAAPVHRTGARTRVVLQLLDEQQLSAIDATEPNYDRVEVTATRYPVVLAGGLRPRRVHVYASQRGVLTLGGPGSTALLAQPDVLAALDAAGVPHTGGDPHEAAGRLASSPEVREAVGTAMRRLGLVRHHGLHTAPAGRLRWADAVAPGNGPGTALRRRRPARPRPARPRRR